MGRSPTHDVWFTVKEAAAFWKVAETTIYLWIKTAHIEPVGPSGWHHSGPRFYRFGELAAAEQRFRTSGRGRPRSVNRR